MILVNFVIVVFILPFILVDVESNSRLFNAHQNESPKEEFYNFWKSIDRIESDHFAKWSPVANRIHQITAELNQSSSQCYQAVEATFRSGIRNEWSAKLINANSFVRSDFVSNLISEQYSTLGDYEECISLNDLYVNDQTFDGKYCLASLETPQLGFYSRDVESAKLSNFTTSSYLNQLALDWIAVRNRFPFTFAICAPSICDSQDLNILINKYFEYYLNGIKLNVGYCQQMNQVESIELNDLPFAISKFLITTFILTTFLGTILYSAIKIVQQKFSISCPANVVNIVECFHIGHNFRSLFRVKPCPSHKYDLTFIHGAKVFFMSFVIHFHCLYFIPVLHLSKVAPFSKYPSYYYFIRDGFMNNNSERGFFAIDIFFALSGFLVTYMTLSKFKKMPNFSVFILSRWFRLVPSVASILSLTILFQKLGSGPMFHPHLTEPYVKPCIDYWWTHIFLISNFWTLDNMCGPNLWFVATDFQLHILVYPILFLYFRKQILLFVASFAMIGFSILLFSCIILFTDIRIPYNDYVINFQFELPLDQIRLFYTTPLLHIIPYFLAVIIGVTLLKLKKKPNYSPYFDYLLLVFFFFILVCHSFPLMRKQPFEQNEFTTIWESFFFLLIFIIHALILVGLFLSAIFSSSKFWVRRLLSAHFIIPLSRLSYGIYLVNILLIWYNVQQSSQVHKLTNLYVVQTYFTVYFESILLAMLMYVFAEAPLNNLFKLFMKIVAQSNKNAIENEFKNYSNGNHIDGAKYSPDPSNERKFDDLRLSDNCV